MAVTPFEIIAGPASVYIAATGTAFPVVNAAPGGSWTNLGKTEGGVMVRHGQEVELLRADQSTGPIKAIRVEEQLEIEFALTDLTLENFAKALNSATVTSNAGPPATKEILLRQGFDVARYALLVRGPSPYGNFNAQYQVPVVVNTGEAEVEYTREDKAVLNTAWVALEDLTAGTEGERFGKLIAQTS